MDWGIGLLTGEWEWDCGLGYRTVDWGMGNGIVEWGLGYGTVDWGMRLWTETRVKGNGHVVTRRQSGWY